LVSLVFSLISSVHSSQLSTRPHLLAEDVKLHPCVGDLRNYCSIGLPSTFEEILTARLCLHTNSKEMSKECSVYVLETSPSIIEPCFEGIKNYCNGVVPGNGALHQCLMDNLEDQTVRCANALFDDAQEVDDDDFNVIVLSPIFVFNPTNIFEMMFSLLLPSSPSTSAQSMAQVDGKDSSQNSRSTTSLASSSTQYYSSGSNSYGYYYDDLYSYAQYAYSYYYSYDDGNTNSYTYSYDDNATSTSMDIRTDPASTTFLRTRKENTLGEDQLEHGSLNGLLLSFFGSHVVLPCPKTISELEMNSNDPIVLIPSVGTQIELEPVAISTPLVLADFTAEEVSARDGVSSPSSLLEIVKESFSIVSQATGLSSFLASRGAILNPSS